MKLRLLLLGPLLATMPLRAQPDASPKASPAAKAGASSSSQPQIADTTGTRGTEIEKVRIDEDTRTITFPASVNMDSGAVEYLLVRAGGKTHESVFATEVDPVSIHVAMVLLGAKGSPQKDAADTPQQAIDNAYLQHAPELAGEKISISVSWKNGDVAQHANAEDFIWNTKERAPMSRGPWLYTGSILLPGGKFLAQQELSIAALVIDPAALINNPRPGNRDDSIWEINSKKAPPAGTPVEITIQLQQLNKTLNK